MQCAVGFLTVSCIYVQNDRSCYHGSIAHDGVAAVVNTG